MKATIITFCLIIPLTWLHSLDIEMDGKAYKNVSINLGKTEKYVKLYHDGGYKIVTVKKLPRLTLKTKEGKTFPDAKITALTKKGIDITYSGKIRFIKYRELDSDCKKIFAPRKYLASLNKEGEDGQKSASNEPKPGKSYTISALDMKMVFIKDGVFKMGTEKGPANQVQHRVKLSKPFWVGKFEVTQEQYQKLMPEHSSSETLGPNMKGDDKPVSAIRFFDAHQFCKKLTEQESEAGRIPKNYEYRLPTEAEWEYVARSGGNHKKNKKQRTDKIAWFSGNADNQLHPVGKKRPNTLGIHDLFGNVSEYCADECVIKEGQITSHSYKDKSVDPLSVYTGKEGEPSDPDRAIYRIVRGGSILDDESFCSPDKRSSTHEPKEKRAAVGFRVCLGRKLTMPEPKEPKPEPTKVAAEQPPGPDAPPPPEEAIPPAVEVKGPEMPPKEADTKAPEAVAEKEKPADAGKPAGPDAKQAETTTEPAAADGKKAAGTGQEKCPTCNGTKKSFGVTCPACKGTGLKAAQ